MFLHAATWSHKPLTSWELLDKLVLPLEHYYEGSIPYLYFSNKIDTCG